MLFVMRTAQTIDPRQAVARRVTHVSAMVALLCALAVGCGDEESESGSAKSPSSPAKTSEPSKPAASPADEAEIRKTYATFIRDLYGRRFPKACTAFGKDFKAELGGERACAKQLKDFLGDTPQNYPRPKLATVEVTGERASGVAKAKGAPDATINFVKDDDGWKLILATSQ